MILYFKVQPASTHVSRGRREFGDASFKHTLCCRSLTTSAFYVEQGQRTEQKTKIKMKSQTFSIQSSNNDMTEEISTGSHELW